ncbi:glycosyltransferase [Nitrospira sp. Ecomares 2.1]
MKILHIFHDLLETGGTPFQVRSLVQAQADLGHDVLAVSYKGDSERISSNVQSVQLGKGLRSVLQFRKVLQSFKPHIIHLSGIWIPVHHVWLKEVFRFGVPCIISTNGNLSPHGFGVRFGGKRTHFYHIWRKELWHKYFDAPMLKAVACVHTPSKYEAEILAELGVTKRFVAPVGINASWIKSQPCDGRKLNDPVTFLHLGRLDIFHKGLDLVCDAVEVLMRSPNPKPFRVIMAGPSVNDSMEKLKKRVAGIGSEIFDFRDYVSGEEKKMLWTEADYFLNVYRYAGIALAPCEALGNGIPLIASLEGNLGDWTQRMNMGITVPLSGTHLADGMATVLEYSEDMYQRVSENAMKFCLSYSWEKVAQDLVDEYKRIIDDYSCGMMP